MHTHNEPNPSSTYPVPGCPECKEGQVTMTEETVTMETFEKHAKPAPVKRGWAEFVDTLEVDIPRRVPDHLRYAPVKDVRIMLRATAHNGNRLWSLRFAEIDGDLFVVRIK